MHWSLPGGKAAFKINNPFDIAAREKIIQEKPFFRGVFNNAVLQYVGGVQFFVIPFGGCAVPIRNMPVVIET